MNLHLIMTVAVLAIVALSILLVVLIKSYMKEAAEEEKRSKKYVLSVGRTNQKGEYVTQWHGGNSNNWILSYDEAISRKNKVAHFFEDVKIVEYKDWMIATTQRVHEPKHLIKG